MRWEPADPALRDAALAVCRLVRDAGGRALLVGGCVRDAVLEHPPTDLDLEVYGVPPDRLESLLEQRFRVDRVGRAFGVLKIRGLALDVSLPRREFKIGEGHRGFHVQADPDLTPADASLRRDFTINAMALDPLTGELIDPHGGRRDLERRVLRHVSEKFAEDPLRVLRGMQLVARFDLTADPATVALCRTLGMEGLARERIEQEWRKLVLQGARISAGLAFLRDTTWLRFFPELAALVDCPQDPAWHPEGDVWTHTLHCMDAFAAERTGDAWEDWVVGLAVLCHDMGKPLVLRREGERITTPGHDRAGVEPARRFLQRLTRQRDLFEQVLPLVAAHMAPRQLYEGNAGDAAVRRLARRVGRIDRLVRVARADFRGRGPSPDAPFPAGDWLLARARRLAVLDARPRPLVMGRHLLDIGLEPGPHLGAILDACYEAQLDGRITTLEEGLALARELARRPADDGA